jgi:hypothetical protein
MFLCRMPATAQGKKKITFCLYITLSHSAGPSRPKSNRSQPCPHSSICYLLTGKQTKANRCPTRFTVDIHLPPFLQIPIDDLSQCCNSRIGTNANVPKQVKRRSLHGSPRTRSWRRELVPWFSGRHVLQADRWSGSRFCRESHISRVICGLVVFAVAVGVVVF